MGAGRLVGVIVSLGGQTPLKLAAGIPPELVLGTPPASIDLAEDREQWNELCARLGIPQPPGGTATTAAEAVAVASSIGYPVLVRPSYVLGGRAMEIVYDDERLVAAVEAMSGVGGSLGREGGVTADRPVLVDRFLEDAVEVDVDAVRDATGEVVICGVMEHVEEAGVHSGDSACALPPQTLSASVIAELERTVRVIAESLAVQGLINVQFAVKDDQAYVLEANPRASRTVPFVAKATGVPVAMVAARVMVGATLAELRQEGLLTEPVTGHVSVKEAVLPFNRFPGVDTLLGPEMRSTGEVMGIGSTFGLAFAKSQIAAGNRLPVERHGLPLPGRPGQGGRPRCRPAVRRPGLRPGRHLGHGGHAGGRGHRRLDGGGQGGGVPPRCGRRRRPDRRRPGPAGGQHPAGPRAAGRRSAHPGHRPGPHGAVPDHGGRGPGRGGRHRRLDQPSAVRPLPAGVPRAVNR